MKLDIFNKHKVRELEERLLNAEMERNRYRNMAIHLENRLDDISKFDETIPEDCKKGPWCAACEFGKAFHYMAHYDFGVHSGVTKTFYGCGKGESCKNFIQKEIDHD